MPNCSAICRVLVATLDEDEIAFRLDILPRFDLQEEQFEKILEKDREKNNNNIPSIGKSGRTPTCCSSNI